MSNQFIYAVALSMISSILTPVQAQTSYRTQAYTSFDNPYAEGGAFDPYRSSRAKNVSKSSGINALTAGDSAAADLGSTQAGIGGLGGASGSYLQSGCSPKSRKNYGNYDSYLSQMSQGVNLTKCNTGTNAASRGSKLGLVANKSGYSGNGVQSSQQQYLRQLQVTSH